MIGAYVAWPYWLRAALVLFVGMFIFGFLPGRFILWILSIIPYALQKIFRACYMLVELPVSWLHKKFGLSFYEVDNHLSSVGEKVDVALSRWYGAWHKSEKIHFGRFLLVYAACTVLVVAPSLIETKSSFLKIGETAYTFCETSFVDWTIKNGWYDPYATASADQEVQEVQEEQAEDAAAETQVFEEKMVVSGVSTSLLVRKVPSIKKGEILGRLKNGDQVTWNGKMRFAKVEDDRTEPWVKIATEDGVKGWCRLFYLRPQENKKKVFQVMGLE